MVNDLQFIHQQVVISSSSEEMREVSAGQQAMIVQEIYFQSQREQDGYTKIQIIIFLSHLFLFSGILH